MLITIKLLKIEMRHLESRYFFLNDNNNNIYLFKVKYPMYIDVQVQWTI